jgi:hypothetical protein
MKLSSKPNTHGKVALMADFAAFVNEHSLSSLALYREARSKLPKTEQKRYPAVPSRSFGLEDHSFTSLLKTIDAAGYPIKESVLRACRGINRLRPSFPDFKALVANYFLHCYNGEAYKEFARQNPDLGWPIHPEETYKDEWRCWGDFLALPEASVPFELLETAIKKHKIDSVKKWKKLKKEKKLPAAAPYEIDEYIARNFIEKAPNLISLAEKILGKSDKKKRQARKDFYDYTTLKSLIENARRDGELIASVAAYKRWVKARGDKRIPTNPDTIYARSKHNYIWISSGRWRGLLDRHRAQALQDKAIAARRPARDRKFMDFKELVSRVQALATDARSKKDLFAFIKEYNAAIGPDDPLPYMPANPLTYYGGQMGRKVRLYEILPLDTKKDKARFLAKFAELALKFHLTSIREYEAAVREKKINPREHGLRADIKNAMRRLGVKSRELTFFNPFNVGAYSRNLPPSSAIKTLITQLSPKERPTTFSAVHAYLLKIGILPAELSLATFLIAYRRTLAQVLRQLRSPYAKNRKRQFVSWQETKQLIEKMGIRTEYEWRVAYRAGKIDRARYPSSPSLTYKISTKALFTGYGKRPLMQAKIHPSATVRAVIDHFTRFLLHHGVGSLIDFKGLAAGLKDKSREGGPIDLKRLAADYRKMTGLSVSALLKSTAYRETLAAYRDKSRGKNPPEVTPIQPATDDSSQNDESVQNDESSQNDESVQNDENAQNDETGKNSQIKMEAAHG